MTLANRAITRRPAAWIPLIALAACAELDPLEAELLVPNDLALHWDRSFNGEADDRVALVPLDLMVYGAVSGEPVAGVALQVEPGFDAVELLVVDQVVPMDAEDCGPCAWDAWRDRYVELVEADGASEALFTDEDGLARAFLLVDAFPEGELGFESVPVSVVSATGEATFHLVPQ